VKEMAKYKIWDRKETIKTYTGRKFTAEEWMDRHPVLRLAGIVPVCGGGEINGSFMGTLGSMVEGAERKGCDFSDCATDEEKLARIEEFESRPKERAVTAEERIAAALEYQNAMAE
jgi:hypothetical protein